jgi:glycosyltransferase involved in cell wall biosynthesis
MMSFPLIIVTTYNRLPFTKQCLTALELTASSFHCVVVDNGSRPETVEYLRQWCQRETPFGGRFDVCLLDQNYGVGKAMNYGLKKRLPGQHAMKLDNDMIVPTVSTQLNNGVLNGGWLDQTLDLLENNFEGLTHVGFSAYDDEYIASLHNAFIYEKIKTSTEHEYNILFYQGSTVLGAGVMYSSDVIDELGVQH